MKLSYYDYRNFTHWMCNDIRNQNALKYFYEIMTSYSLYEKYCLLPKPEDRLYCMQQIQTSGPFPLHARPLSYIIMERIAPNERRYSAENFAKRLLNKKTNEFLAPISFRTELTDEFSFTHPLTAFIENSLLFENLVMELSLDIKKVEKVPLLIANSVGSDFYTNKEIEMEDLPFGLVTLYLWNAFSSGEYDPKHSVVNKTLEIWSELYRFTMQYPLEDILHTIKSRVLAGCYNPIQIHNVKGESNDVQ